jgi:hypothetical protein
MSLAKMRISPLAYRIGALEKAAATGEPWPPPPPEEQDELLLEPELLLDVVVLLELGPG